jgi:hypothetical protein
VGVYLKRWEQLKADFEKTTGTNRPKEKQATIIGTIQKSSGLTPVIKDVEAALEKKQRTPLEKALNKLFVTRGTYATFLMNEQKKFVNDPSDPDMIVWTAYRDLTFGIQHIEQDAAKEAAKLQEEKGGGKVAIQWLSLEGDIKGTVQAAKKAFASYAAQEKKNKLLEKSEGAVKAAEAYTKAAAHTKYKEAREALELFKKEAKKCSDECAKVLSAEKDAGYKKGVQSHHDAMKALSVLARIDAQIKNLQDAERAG